MTTHSLAAQEAYALEDLCADYLELTSSVGVPTPETVHHFEPAARLHKLLALSAGIEADGAFARQARRKFV